MKHTKTNSSEVFAKNLEKLMELRKIKKAELARRCGVSARHIGYLLERARVPSIDVADQIARAFDLQGWHLLMSDFQPEFLNGGAFDKLLHSYVEADQDGRKVMETAAEYVSTHKKSADNDPNAPKGDHGQQAS